jgi:hypothetical protein
MSITIDDISYVKSKTITNTDENGGRIGTAVVVSGTRHSLFPRVTKNDRTNGVVRYRKQFWKNANEDNLQAYDVIQWLEFPSNAGDRFYIKKGTKTDVQSDLTSPPVGSVVLWTGCGMLETELSSGESSIAITMEANDFSFENGEFLHICDRVQTSQTVDTSVKVGDSVTESGGTWIRISATSDITYPNGLYLGDNSILTAKETTSEEWLKIAEKITVGEVLGFGDGNTVVSLSSLANAANGICNYEGKTPVLTTKAADSSDLTVVLNQDGTVNTGESDASAGTLNMNDGSWSVPITWTTAPGTGENITVSYREKAYKYTGNVVVVDLEEQVANSYLVGNTTVSGCVYEDLVEASISNLIKSSATGDYDHDSFPLVAHQPGAVDDTITIVFTTGSDYTVSVTNLGTVGTGTVSGTKVFTNPENNESMLTVNHLAWSGSFSVGDSFTFSMVSSSSPVWLKEDVPAGTEQEPNNLCVVAYYME